MHFVSTWWRHQMETFSALLAICAGNSPVPGEFPAQRPVTRSFDVFFDLSLNKRLSKQWWGWWFENQSCPLWHHCNETRPLFPGPPTPDQNVYHARTRFREKGGIFSMGGANSRNHAKGDILQAWVREILKKGKFCMYLIPFVCSECLNCYA